MKLLGAIVAISILALVSCENSQWGSRQPGDRLLDMKTYTKSSKWMQVVTMEINYTGPYVITFMQAIDKGKGGKASLLQGGAGNTAALLKLKSKRGKGLDFQIEIYGR